MSAVKYTLCVLLSITIINHAQAEEPGTNPDMKGEGNKSSESQQEEDSSSSGILSISKLTRSPTPSAEDKIYIQVDCLIVDVLTGAKMDRETTVIVEDLFFKKVTLRENGQLPLLVSSTVDVLLKKITEATAPIKDTSAKDKRVTQEQFMALVDLLASRGFVRILANPTLQVVNGQTAKIYNNQDYLQITPEVLDDGDMMLWVEGAVSRQSRAKSKEQTPIVTETSISTQARIGPGMSLIINGKNRPGKNTEIGSDANAPDEQTTELLFILTPTIVNAASKQQNRTESPVGKPVSELKGLVIELQPNDLEGNKILVCFWEMEQRSSRNLVSELAGRKKELEKSGVVVVLVHSSSVDADKLKQWLDKAKITFACGSIEKDAEKVLYRWGVRAQPWLVLIDERRVVSAGGFGLESLTPEGLRRLLEPAKSKAHIYKLKHAQPEKVAESLKKILEFRAENLMYPKAEPVIVAGALGTNELAIAGNEQEVQVATNFLAELDVTRDQIGSRRADTRVYELYHVDSERLAELLTALFTGVMEVWILPHKSLNKLAIQASDPDHKKIEKLIRLLDVPPGGPVIGEESIATKLKPGIIPKGFDEFVKRREAAKRARPKREPDSLVGKPVPGMKDFGVDLSSAEANDKMLLVCFFDVEQRPSRYCMFQLVKKAEQLTQENVAVIAVQASPIDQNTLNEWVKKNNVPFPVGMIESDTEKTCFAWGVRSLPWLILTNKQHAVQAEGFGIDELDERIATLKEK